MDIPKINKQAVCISTDKSSELARTISSYFLKEGTYFSLFNFLHLKESHKENVDYTEDGFVGHILGNEGSVYIRNLIAQIRPEFIILAGLNDEQKSYFQNLPQKRIIIVDTVEDIESRPDVFIVTDLTEPRQVIADRKDLLVVEDGGGISTVIAENLASAVNADIVHVKDTTDHLPNKISKFIHEWKKKGKYASYIKIENLVKERVGHIDFNKYKSATFFTNGLPYGLVLNNPIPFCYVHKRLREDIFILNTIIYSQKSFGAGISFAIEDFIHSEPKGVSEIFKRNNLLPIELFVKKATAFNFENYVSFLPYDILHISSHGGIKTDGYYIKQNFKDRNGNTHTIEYYEVPTFTGMPLDKTDNVAVYIKDIFLKFDGAPWMSEDLNKRKIPSFVFMDMWKSISRNRYDKKIKRVPVNDPIIDSATVMCSDGPHQGQLHCIAAQNSPLVFNNSCWSWSEISTFFLAGGVRAYIGTLWEISDPIATKAAISLYEDILEKEKTVAQSIWEINKNISTTELGQENIFFAWVLPFCRMKKPEEDDFDNFIQDTLMKLGQWVVNAQSEKADDVRRNSESVVKFILWAVYQEFSFNIIDVAKNDILKEFGYDIGQHSSLVKRSNFKL